MDELPGLTSVEAQKKLLVYGGNVIKQKQGISVVEVVLNQVRTPLILILIIAAAVTIALGESVDGMVILISVIANVILGFTQEWKAERSIEALASLVEPKAKVKRDGVWAYIDVNNVVPGDLVRLEIGMTVPADGILVMEDGMFVNEAILTGESIGVEKHELVGKNANFDKTASENKCFMGTTIERGIGEMVVGRTGSETSMGTIATRLVKTKRDKTPLQIRLSNLSRQLAILVVIIVGLVFIVGLLTKRDTNEIFIMAVALAVAAIPEGLAVGLVVILSVGMKRILAKNALVRKLTAAETLGSVNVICLDKTGTITEGKMRVIGAVSSSKGDLEEQLSGKLQNKKNLEGVLEGALLCNDMRDPLEVAMNGWAYEQLGEKKAKLLQNSNLRRNELPFDPKYRYIVTRHQDGDAVTEYLSGAPEIILEMSKLKNKSEKQKWTDLFGDIGRHGYRMVAFAVRKLGKNKAKVEIKRSELKDYEWLGLIVFNDPVREGVIGSLVRAVKAGIRIKVITGDYKETAWSALKQVGLVTGDFNGSLVMTGEEINSHSTESRRKIEKSVLFARTSPEQKLDVVKNLQMMGYVVAMTGDGVNDAPALKQADIGVVLNNASDVARETAEIVLLDNNFATILIAVEEGRLIFENLRKVVLYLLADAFAGIILVIGAMVLGWPLPLLATQILWINLITDGLPYVSLALEKESRDLLKLKPIKRDEPILTKSMGVLIGVISLTSAILTLSTFGYYLNTMGMSLAMARTAALATLGTVTLIYAFSVRSLFEPVWRKNPLRNIWLVIGVALGMMLLLAVIYSRGLQMIFGTVDIPLKIWGCVGISVLIMMIVVEGSKWLINRLKKRDLMEI